MHLVDLKDLEGAGIVLEKEDIINDQNKSKNQGEPQKNRTNSLRDGIHIIFIFEKKKKLKKKKNIV